MKKILLYSFLLLTAVAGRAQTITNAGMETWHNYNVSLFPLGSIQLQAPTAWAGSDSMVASISFFATAAGISITPTQQIFQSADAHSGSSAAEIKTALLNDTLAFPGILFNAGASVNLLGIDINDPDFSSILDLIQFRGGTPIGGRKVDSVHAWVKLTDANTDNGMVLISAMQRTQNSSGQDTLVPIGTGAAVIANNEGNAYREISIPVLYADPANTATDTLYIGFASSFFDEAATVTPGNTLLVDDVSMTTSDGSGTVSVRQPLMADDIALVYPNPAKDKIYFNLNPAQRPAAFSLLIADAAGRIVVQRPLQDFINEQPVKGWSKGNYFYILSSRDQVVKGKFVVQ